jgi:hypothetical protein
MDFTKIAKKKILNLLQWHRWKLSSNLLLASAVPVFGLDGTHERTTAHVIVSAAKIMLHLARAKISYIIQDFVCEFRNIGSLYKLK